jgi:hypothetical protein
MTMVKTMRTTTKEKRGTRRVGSLVAGWRKGARRAARSGT